MDVSRICSLLDVKQHTVRELTGGYHNEAVLLNEEFVLRSGSKHLQHEYAFLTSHGFGPEAHLYDKESNTLVTQYLNAAHPEEYDKDLLVQLTTLLNELHSLPAKNQPTDFSWIHTYAQHSLPPAAKQLYTEFSKIQQPLPTTIIHGDLARTNILLTNPLTLIDWEFWQYSTPEMELAGLYFKLRKTPQLMQVVFNNYTHPINQQAYHEALLTHATKNVVSLQKALHKQDPKPSKQELIQRRDWYINYANNNLL